MDETLKKAVALGVVGSVTLMSGVSINECGRRDLCEVKSADLPHDHQRNPSPVQSTAKEVVKASATSSLGEYTFLRRQSQPPLYWRK